MGCRVTNYCSCRASIHRPAHAPSRGRTARHGGGSLRGGHQARRPASRRVLPVGAPARPDQGHRQVRRSRHAWSHRGVDGGRPARGRRGPRRVQPGRCRAPRAAGSQPGRGELHRRGVRDGGRRKPVPGARRRRAGFRRARSSARRWRRRDGERRRRADRTRRHDVEHRAHGRRSRSATSSPHSPPTA